jgi:ankyrin repeat protein
MPPLFAVTHSTLLRLPEFRDRLRRCARLLLDAGADPNQSWKDKNWGHPVVALYGAAGKNHDAELTKMLLDAGADPNDGESLYHAVEGPGPESAA